MKHENLEETNKSEKRSLETSQSGLAKIQYIQTCGKAIIQSVLQIWTIYTRLCIYGGLVSGRSQISIKH